MHVLIGEKHPLLEMKALLNGLEINVENKNQYLKLFHFNSTKIFKNRLFFQRVYNGILQRESCPLKGFNIRTKKFDLMGIVIIMNVF